MFSVSGCTCVGDGVAVRGFKLLQLKPGQVQVLSYLDRVCGLPVVDEVISGPPV